MGEKDKTNPEGYRRVIMHADATDPGEEVEELPPRVNTSWWDAILCAVGILCATYLRSHDKLGESATVAIISVGTVRGTALFKRLIK